MSAYHRHLIKTEAAVFVGVLDTYPSALAYSTRRLRAAQTLCCRVRRSSDNVEQDIGFTYNGTNWVKASDDTTLIT